MDKRIRKFIGEQKNLTLCTCENNVPYCASCFYAYNEDTHTLIFKSSPNTRHIEMALRNDRVAGTIIPDIGKVGTIKGVQFTGKFVVPAAGNKSAQLYYRRFPFAVAAPGEIWTVELQAIKMIDNTLGFGTKLSWERDVAEKITT
jgi:uncharacterized protein